MVVAIFMMIILMWFKSCCEAGWVCYMQEYNFDVDVDVNVDVDVV